MLNKSDLEIQELLSPKTTLDAWTFDGIHIKESIEGVRILNPSIDLSNKCNLNCPYCYIEKVGSLKKEIYGTSLSITEYLTIIKKLFDAGSKTINIIGSGEPTIDDDFYEIVKYIHSLGMKILIATNGIAIAQSENLLDFLYKVEASIVIKVNSFKEDLQDCLVGRIGYSKIRDTAINRLLEKGFNESKPTKLGINTLLMKSNAEEIFDIFKYCRENNIAFIAGKYMPTGRTENYIFQGDYLLNDKKEAKLFEPITDSEYNTIRKKIYEYDVENNYPTNSPEAYISGLPCIQGLGIQIDNRGLIWHCPTRQQLIKGKLIPEELCKYEESIDFLKLWREHSYINNFRNNYNGECPYKKIKYNSNEKNN